ncbi:MAG TPA: hypothetical protein VFJ58_01310, partial [Armatimonadota bacterium]|nr:hypothetical protein [Armatimonadota bacterium]
MAGVSGVARLVGRTFLHSFAIAVLAAIAAAILLISASAAAVATTLKSAPPIAQHAGYPVRVVPAAPHRTPVTILNELGRLARPVSSLELSVWKAQLHHGHLPADTAAKLHIRLGEYELAANEQPAMAIWHFNQVSKHAAARLRGLAKYDTAVAGYYQGAYGETEQAFKQLLSPKTGLPGYSIKACALWVRMAGVC